MHNDVVRRENFVYIIERHAFWGTRCTGCLETDDFVVNMGCEINDRIIFCGVLHIAGVQDVSFGSSEFFHCMVDGDDRFGTVFAQLQRPDSSIGYFRVVNVYFRFVMVDDLRRFTGREVEICRIADGAYFLGGNVGKEKFRRIEKLEENDVAFFYAVFFECIGKAICFLVELCVSPCVFSAGSITAVR